MEAEEERAKEGCSVKWEKVQQSLESVELRLA
jgi:hypothetical protein